MTGGVQGEDGGVGVSHGSKVSAELQPDVKSRLLDRVV